MEDAFDDMFQRLRVRANVGYGPRPIPDETDRVIREFVDAYVKSLQPVRAAVAERLGREHAPTLRAFAERMAAYAVRQRSRPTLVAGLVALGLAALADDYREALLVLSLFVRSAQHLAVDPAPLFEEAGAVLSPAVAAWLTHFLVRGDEDNDIRAMGYEEISPSEGFRYRRTW